MSIVHPESRLTENAKTRKINDVLDEDGKELTSDMKVRFGVCVLRAPLSPLFRHRFIDKFTHSRPVLPSAPPR